MWIVALALRRPYTFIVMALLILILSPIAIVRTPVDILPEINIPVVSVIWQYQGLSAQEMTDRIVSNTERFLTTTVNDIEHIETQAMEGRAIEKIFFQPNANLPTAIAQVTSTCQTAVRNLPPGTQPPLIIVYSASSVPIMQVGIRGKALPEQALFDYSINFVRPQMTMVKGAAIPYPYGGKQRLVAVDLDPAALQARGLTAVDVVNPADRALAPTLLTHSHRQVRTFGAIIQPPRMTRLRPAMRLPMASPCSWPILPGRTRRLRRRGFMR